MSPEVLERLQKRVRRMQEKAGRTSAVAIFTPVSRTIRHNPTMLSRRDFRRGSRLLARLQKGH